MAPLCAVLCFLRTPLDTAYYKRIKYNKYLVLVKNRTSHGSLGSRQTTHAYDTSLETAVKMSAIRCTLYAILQQTKKLSTL